jgi:hypothetical protein
MQKCVIILICTWNGFKKYLISLFLQIMPSNSAPAFIIVCPLKYFKYYYRCFMALMELFSVAVSVEIAT